MAGPMGGGGEERHLYPDLCEGEGLLGAVVTAELLALLVVVARAGVERFDWGLLGTASLMALWVALLAGGAPLSGPPLAGAPRPRRGVALGMGGRCFASPPW
ncbi:MAG: hypothetical protein KatS3mg124_0522 [Porticoccaceae bacterium]|nr:MAG: hypothetical protein KatS3mg124_0522 [Porticoccaceae bacterium]